MKTKYNCRFPITNNEISDMSLIQKNLRGEINTLLAPSAMQISQLDFDSFYIPNPDMERPLEKCKSHTAINNICLVEGLTGCGKSTLIRHVFGIHSVAAKIQGSTLVIPFNNFNERQFDSNIEGKFTHMLRAACDSLKERFPYLSDSNVDIDAFYSFIKDINPELLYFEEKYPEPNKAEQLQAFLKQSPFLFRSNELKYYLSQVECGIDNVLIVVDDLEGIRLESPDEDYIKTGRIELLPIKLTIALIKDLENMGGKASSWSLNTVICCRHYVSRMMQTVPYEVTITKTKNYIGELSSLSDSGFERIDFDTSSTTPAIIDIILKRYRVICGHYSGEQLAKWKLAMSVVIQLLKRIDSRIGTFILNLTLSNNREAMDIVKKLIFNRMWLQNDHQSRRIRRSSLDDITLSQYNTSAANLIRAIGMNESRVYNSAESIIPNLLDNDQNKDNELFVLLALKYFRNLAKFRASSWKTSISIKAFFHSVQKLFSSDVYTDYFRESTYFLLKNRLILRSCEQDQYNNAVLSEDDFSSIEYVYVPKIAEEMWTRLGNSSVLFEMFVDDIWMECDSRTDLYAPVNRGLYTDNFQVCLDYMEVLICAESIVAVQKLLIEIYLVLRQFAPTSLMGWKRVLIIFI